MMKQVNIQFPLRMLGLILGLFLSVSAFAQIDVKGHVKDATGEPIIGEANEGASITVSYVGYQNQTVKAAPNLVITLQEDANNPGHHTYRLHTQRPFETGRPIACRHSTNHQ